MPELPEVETVRRILEKNYLNQTINKIDILYPKMIHSPLDEFKKNIEGNKIISFTRKGKYLFINLSNNYTIISHLRMEGKYIKYNEKENNSPYAKIVFHLNNDIKLCYDDSRCFGIMYLCKTNDVFNNVEVKKLGLEPFEISSYEYLYNIFSKRNIEIKNALLDQSIMCGLGNIYCDEVLFLSKINPFKKANKLTKDEIELILNNSKKILLKAIELGGSTVSSYHPEKGVDGRFQNQLNVYGKEKTPCPICKTILRKTKLNGRGTTYCPSCQKVARTIGVTGKIASGKSTVLSLFKENNYPVFSCDEEVKKLYSNDIFKMKLINIFKEECLNDDLSISKQYIKNQINQSPELKKELENLIHPIIKEKILHFIKSNREEKLIIVEVPLLFETKMNLLFDYIIGVSCSSITQINHLKNRGSKNINMDLILNKSNQFDKNAKKCDFLINNDGSYQELVDQVNSITTSILNK